jgi:hypothetical protein
MCFASVSSTAFDSRSDSNVMPLARSDRLQEPIQPKDRTDRDRLRGCGCSADRTGLHGANSRLSGKRTGNLVNSRGVAITGPRTNTRHFRRFSAKFPVRIEPGILLSNREFFLSNREISSAKTGNRRPSYARPLPTRGKGRLALAAVPGRNGNADSQITD